MDLCKVIPEQQDWQGEPIAFDPDSSPEAWKYYLSAYDDEMQAAYDFDNLCFFEYVKTGRFRGKYTAKRDNSKPYSRLYAIKKDAVPLDGKRLYYEPCLRLSGDTDFNFNDKQYEKFRKIIKDAESLSLLDECRKKHHTLQNFSLMQTVGNMQGMKARGLMTENGFEWMDRLDSFIFLLSEHFKNPEQSPLKNYPISEPNYNELCKYLSAFQSINDYCRRMYFIQDELIDRLIENGRKHITEEEAAKEYLLLANAFWQQKREHMEAKR